MIRKVFHLLTHPSSNVLAFLFIGLIGLFVDMGCYALASLWLPTVGARFVSIPVAITATWLLNRRYAFQVSSAKSLRREYVHYFLSSLCGAAVNYLSFIALVAFLPKAMGMDYLAIFFSSAMAAGVNFLLYKNVVFTPPTLQPEGDR